MAESSNDSFTDIIEASQNQTAQQRGWYACWYNESMPDGSVRRKLHAPQRQQFTAEQVAVLETVFETNLMPWPVRANCCVHGGPEPHVPVRCKCVPSPSAGASDGARDEDRPVASMRSDLVSESAAEVEEANGRHEGCGRRPLRRRSACSYRHGTGTGPHVSPLAPHSPRP